MQNEDITWVTDWSSNFMFFVSSYFWPVGGAVLYGFLLVIVGKMSQPQKKQALTDWIRNETRLVRVVFTLFHLLPLFVLLSGRTAAWSLSQHLWACCAPLCPPQSNTWTVKSVCNKKVLFLFTYLRCYFGLALAGWPVHYHLRTNVSGEGLTGDSPQEESGVATAQMNILSWPGSLGLNTVFMLDQSAETQQLLSDKICFFFGNEQKQKLEERNCSSLNLTLRTVETLQ